MKPGRLTPCKYRVGELEMGCDLLLMPSCRPRQQTPRIGHWPKLQDLHLAIRSRDILRRSEAPQFVRHTISLRSVQCKYLVQKPEIPSLVVPRLNLRPTKRRPQTFHRRSPKRNRYRLRSPTRPPRSPKEPPYAVRSRTAHWLRRRSPGQKGSSHGCLRPAIRSANRKRDS